VYEAIAARDARAMVERASALLAATEEADDDWGRYLLVTAMRGSAAALADPRERALPERGNSPVRDIRRRPALSRAGSPLNL